MIRLFVPLALGLIFAWLDTSLTRLGYSSWDFLRSMNGAGSAAFDLYTALLVALSLRIAAFVVTLAVLSPSASRASSATTVALLVLIGSMAAFLALPTFGLSVLVFAVAEYFVFFVLATGATATEAILRSPRIAAKTLPLTVTLVILPGVAAAGAQALVWALHAPAVAVLAGWLAMEIALAWGLSRASVAYETRLHG